MFRADRCEVFGTVRGTGLAPFTLAVFGNHYVVETADGLEPDRRELEIGNRQDQADKQKWGQLTDDDLAQINGRRDQLEGKIQQCYGLAKDLVRKDVDDGWMPSRKRLLR